MVLRVNYLFLGIINNGNGFGLRLTVGGSLLRFCLPMGVEAIAFNNACKVFISGFPVKALITNCALTLIGDQAIADDGVGSQRDQHNVRAIGKQTQA